MWRQLSPLHHTLKPRFNQPPPTANPYSANAPADPSLWDGDFSATSIFGTNEFLQNDVRNIACSLSHMATFLRQRNNGNNIPQLELFGEAAWSFVSAVFESGWDKLNTADMISFRKKITSQFINNSPPPPASSNRNTIRKVPPPSPPRLSKAQLERSKHHNTGTSHKGKTNPTPTKSFAQVASAAANILQIKEAFPTLPNKKIMEIHNAAFDKPAQRTKKSKSLPKAPLENRPLFLSLTNTLKQS